MFDQPNIIYTIFQPSKTGNLKNRLIFCPPFAVTILELVVFSKTCDFFTRNDRSSIVMGNSQMDLFNLNLKHKKEFKYSGDYSSYDQTLPSLLICTIFFMLFHLFDFSPSGEDKNNY